jgi:DNA-binding response OmpR family regulator
MAHDLILLWENDRVVARFLGSLLARGGFGVLEASGVEEAYRLCLERKPSLVLCDLASDSDDAFALLGAVRRDWEIGSTPFLILSVRSREEDVVRGFEAGCDDFVVKPFNARELLARIRRLLERSGNSR